MHTLRYVSASTCKAPMRSGVPSGRICERSCAMRVTSEIVGTS